MPELAVVLYRVGRNLGRAYRTAEAFGVRRLMLVDCDDSTLQGNLFGARGNVALERIPLLPSGPATLALETDWRLPLWEVDWSCVELLAIGGETSGLPRRHPWGQKATIPMVGEVSGLTVEAALAIALYERSRRC